MIKWIKIYLSEPKLFNGQIWSYKLTPKLPYGFWTKLSNFGHSWRNHSFQELKCKN
jgi:hypothetical protein